MNDLMREFQQRIERVLDDKLSQNGVPHRLQEAMRYSTLAGGKRFRALLVYGAGIAVNAPIKRLDAVAAALECVHAYSLIHDDLPAMDDDELRRGKPTSHIQFDEATAILAGDALLTLAFELIASSELNDRQARLISAKLASCAGQDGMVGGQMLDIEATTKQSTESKLNRAQLEDIHRRKTGALINAAVACGAHCAGANESTLNYLQQYSSRIGLAFQVIDDVLDIESTTEQLGKPSGSDTKLGKATYPAIIGLEESKALAENLYHEAIESLQPISDNSGSAASINLLVDLASLVVKRHH